MMTGTSIYCLESVVIQKKRNKTKTFTRQEMFTLQRTEEGMRNGEKDFLFQQIVLILF